VGVVILYFYQSKFKWKITGKCIFTVSQIIFQVKAVRTRVVADESMLHPKSTRK